MPCIVKDETSNRTEGFYMKFHDAEYFTIVA